MDVSLTLNALGQPQPQSPNPTNGVQGTGPGQTLRGKNGVSNWIMSSGGASTLIGGDSGDTFYVRDTTDTVVAAANSGINSIISWAPSYTLPANVQNLTVQTSSGGVGIGNSLNNLLIAQGTGSFTLVAGTGNDVMIGNASGLTGDGAGTTAFVISKGDGNDVISNFVNGTDVVRLGGFTNLTDLSSLQSAMKQVGSDVVLNLTSTETLTFRHETIAQFTAADFALPAGLPNMTLRFDDEFNSFVSSPLGTQGWMTQGGNVWRTLGGNNEAEYYSDSSVGANPFSNSNGVLNITASPGTNPDNLPYNSGIITTAKSFNFEYGFVEVSAKLPAGAGMWPALWLLPTSYGWPPEIDIMEMLGNDPTTIDVGTHSGPTNIGTTTAIHVGDTSTAFHTYAIDWEPTTITWYFDGNAIFKEATPSDMHQPMYLLANLAVGGAGSWPGAPTSASEFPAAMSIDYVRYYASTASTAISGTSVLAPSAPVTINGISSLTPPVTTGAPAPTPPVTTPTPTPTPAPPAPALSTVSMSPGTGSVAAGGVVSIALNFNAAVTVAGGTPTLALNDGGTATYVSGSGTSALVFSYTVLPGQNVASLALAKTGAVTLHGATIVTATGVSSDLSAANGYVPQTTLQIAGGMPTTQLAVSGWGNVYNPGAGTFNVTGSAGGAKVTLGQGNHAVNIVGTNNTINTGNGNDTISIKGDSNTVSTGSGASTITLTGNYQVISVGATPTGTTTINATGFAQQITSTAAGNVNVTGANSNSKITLGNGNDTVSLSGSGNTVTVGWGNSVINAGIGQATVHAAGGNDTIVTLGYANVLDAGAGMNFLHGGSGNDTFVLNGANQGLDTITGFTTSNHDLLDLSRALAVTPFKADLTNIGYFVTSTFAGGNTTLSVDPTAGHQTPVAFAVLVGVNTTVPQMIAAGSFKLG